MSDQKEFAQRLRAMHVPGNPVVLINAWDAASARLLASLGVPAIATTSAGIAFLEGFPDGERITREAMLAGVARISRAVDLPVSADLEAGYGESVEEAAATARGAIANGAAGLNFEDASADPERLVDVEHQAARIAAIRRVGEEYGVPLVINARTDVFLADIGREDERLDHAIARGRRYAEAGADCIFVPGVTDEATLRALVRGIGTPVSALAGGGSDLATFARAGVARVSLGSGPMLYAMSKFRELAKRVLADGIVPVADAPVTHREMNAMFERAG